jgi:hypothetical protein
MRKKKGSSFVLRVALSRKCSEEMPEEPEIKEESLKHKLLHSQFDRFWDGLEVPIVQSQDIKYADII